MKIFWSFKSIPELAEMPKKEQMRIWWRCYWLSFRNWQTWIALIVCGACAALGAILGQMWAGHYLVGGTVGGAIGGAIGGHIHTKMIELHVREYLNSFSEAHRA